jgi:hypothetical protein
MADTLSPASEIPSRISLSGCAVSEGAANPVRMFPNLEFEFCQDRPFGNHTFGIMKDAVMEARRQEAWNWEASASLQFGAPYSR